MMLRSRRLLLAIATVFMLACSTTTSAQDQQYNEYGQDEGYSQDGLYADYARQQQIKEAGKAWVCWNVNFSWFFCSELKTIERVTYFFEISNLFIFCHQCSLTYPFRLCLQFEMYFEFPHSCWCCCWIWFDLIYYCFSSSKSPFGWGKILIGTGVGWVMGGKIHAQRKEKKLNARHKEEQKALYSQYYNDVYQLQQQNAEMSEALKGLGYRVQ